MGRIEREYKFVIVNSPKEVEEAMSRFCKGVAEDMLKNKGEKLISIAIALHKDEEFMRHLRANTWREFLAKKNLTLQEYGELLEK